jgi:hypothetical protein
MIILFITQQLLLLQWLLLHHHHDHNIAPFVPHHCRPIVRRHVSLLNTHHCCCCHFSSSFSLFSSYHMKMMALLWYFSLSIITFVILLSRVVSLLQIVSAAVITSTSVMEGWCQSKTFSEGVWMHLSFRAYVLVCFVAVTCNWCCQRQTTTECHCCLSVVLRGRFYLGCRTRMSTRMSTRPGSSRTKIMPLSKTRATIRVPHARDVYPLSSFICRSFTPF